MSLLGWDRLRHGGLLLDPPRLRGLAEEHAPAPLDDFTERELRRRAAAVLEGAGDVPDFVAFVLMRVCGFDAATGHWLRGSEVPRAFSRRAVTDGTVRPHQLWRGPNDALLPVFLDDEKRLGVGRGRRATSRVLGWLRAGSERLALLTNGRQWRLLFAGLDFDAFCEWDLELWFEEGALSPQVEVLRLLMQPGLWSPPEEGAPPPLLRAIRDSRKGQAELSAVLGERVREAVERLIQGHAEALAAKCSDVDPQAIYRAACRVVMRMVVILFAESRELLPRDNALYHTAYGLTGLMEELEKAAARGGGRLARSWSAWPRVLALFELVRKGSHHPELPVPAYGGALFAPGDPESSDGLARALAVFEQACFEQACFEREALSDRDVHAMLELLTRTRVRLRQGRTSTWMAAPVDFSDLSTEYIGILYEGLLDFELRTAPKGDPVIFLAVGDQPALPLSRLEAMDDKALEELFDKLKDKSGAKDEAETPEEPEEEEATEEAAEEAADEAGGEPEPAGEEDGDERHRTRTRAETWARRAALAAGLVRKPRGRQTPEKKLALEEMLAAKARRLVARVVLPGEWYLVRWGGTRKGSGTFYTRPGLAVPTVHRTLRPLAYDPPPGPDGAPDRDAPAAAWVPKRPEEILALKVCDPACGSGTFLVAALRFLTDALFVALHGHGRIAQDGARAVVRLLEPPDSEPASEALAEELIPCRPDDESFEPRLKALLRRHVVERCIYGVDLDPLAVELCRLSLWIETMDRLLPFSFLDHKIRCGNALVGAWFDTFRHYPVMAFKNREGGDKNHGNGVHFEKNARTKALKAFVKGLIPDLKDFLIQQRRFTQIGQVDPRAVHDRALAVLEGLHALPVHDAAERARRYRGGILGSEDWRALKDAMDLWCACWYWPADKLEHAPLPTTFADPPERTSALARRLAERHRFFHWELEFPDVFRAPDSGFDALLGNPPWDIAKPNSKEFFSNIDPLYRSYGKQEALHRQTEYFADEAVERRWLDYNADFRAQSNFASYAASPFGDPRENDKSQDRFAIARGKENLCRHARWREARARTTGFADPAHPFRHQGSADLNLYKLFLEAAHALLRPGGRLGFVVPSGLYSDHGTQALRRLFLERCRWEWLFGFENRDKIFDIDSRFKFNPIVVEKGGLEGVRTDAIRTAFMRRSLDDWERAEEIATPYSRAQVERFSPKSLAILEIQSARDLEILEKIYANSVLLDDDGPGGWGIRYATEFHMTNDSKLFPPRPKWEAQGYRPDEYSRWLKGDWRPIEELWAELGVDPARPRPVEIELEDWLFDTSAGPDRRQAEAQLKHGHLLKPGDVARTPFRLRCAQPPYDRLPLPRADLPPGIILSRDADAWIHENRIEDIALPLYQGLMFYNRRPNVAQHVRGAGRRAEWNKDVEPYAPIQPQFLIAKHDYATSDKVALRGTKVGIRSLSNATNERTVVAGIIPDLPAGHSVNYLTPDDAALRSTCFLVLSSLLFDWQARMRVAGTNMTYHFLEEMGLPGPPRLVGGSLRRLRGLGLGVMPQAITRVEWQAHDVPLAPQEHRRLSIAADAVIAALYGMDGRDLRAVLVDCDHAQPGGEPTGFWRVDKDKDPKLRHTVLTLVAFHHLEEKIRAAGGDREKGIEAFLAQNHGEGWMLPETLRLADYGLGHDERAKHPQPVASRLGPRFYDWQLTQTAEESWNECRLHARNLLGEAGYRKLLAEIEAGEEGFARTPSEPMPKVAEPGEGRGGGARQRDLFDGD